MAAPTQVAVQCVCNPDVHLGDGRVLKGPVKEGTVVKTPGDVALVDPDLADFLVKRGQVVKVSSDSEVTVTIEQTPDYRVAQAAAAQAMN